MGTWFQVGPLGRFVPVPYGVGGWVVAAGFAGPASVYALRQDLIGSYMACGLLAFLFGFAYAVAGEAEGGPADGGAERSARKAGAGGAPA